MTSIINVVNDALRRSRRRCRLDEYALNRGVSSAARSSSTSATSMRKPLPRNNFAMRIDNVVMAV
jgi:hypothetical protein